MFLRLYFYTKPYLPRSFRLAMRRAWAQRVLRRSRLHWPVLDSAANARPAGWEGWPDGKKIAFVITHDVESSAGLDKVRQLAELEMEVGVRSSFNFIPEGGYEVPPELRHWLVENGFEVGVHDLHHDGHLYRSRSAFDGHAKKINHYLEEWGAVGFRSGFMLRELDWLHDLDVSYDASSFDTDPFEPQPDGCQTIFPLRIAKGDRGYIELPYTLPQDSTLFFLLDQTGPEIWKNKLDWLVEKGGLALLNVHPDYLQFEGAAKKAETFPAAIYREFLEYAVGRYGAESWQALPKEVARFAEQKLAPGATRVPKRVCMVSFSFYESDNRILRYAESLAARGDSVDILALRRSPEVAEEEVIQGVRVFRIQDRFDKSTKGKLGHLLPILKFIWACSRWIKDRQSHERYDLLHMHNMPDFVVFAGRPAKKGGAKVILDIHDLMPDFYASKFGNGKSRFGLPVLRWLEGASAKFADYVIIANDLWRDPYASRTGSGERCTTFINNVDSSVFIPTAEKRQGGDKPVILFPGSLSWHQGVDIGIRAFEKVLQEFPGAEFHIYGDGIAKPDLVAQAEAAGLGEHVRFFKPRGLREIAEIMARADLGIVPKRADSFGNEAYSTKIMEFMSVGVPVVISSTKIDRFYFDETVVRFFESGDADALAREILFLLRHPDEREAMVARAKEYAEKNCWNSRRDDYLRIVDSLCGGVAGSELALPGAATNIRAGVAQRPAV